MKTFIGLAGLAAAAVGVGTIITVQAAQAAAHVIEDVVHDDQERRRGSTYPGMTQAEMADWRIR